MTGDSKLTHNQTVVLSALSASEVPLTAYELLDLDGVRDQGLKAPLTIYRALDRLIDRGLVHRIESINAFVACDHGPHREAVGFMSCENCRATIELPVGECEKLLEDAAEANGFRIDKITVEVFGRCVACSRAS